MKPEDRCQDTGEILAPSRPGSRRIIPFHLYTLPRVLKVLVSVLDFSFILFPEVCLIEIQRPLFQEKLG